MSELDALERVQSALKENSHIKLKAGTTDIKLARELLKTYTYSNGEWAMKDTGVKYKGNDATVIFNAARIAGLLDNAPGTYNPKHVVNWSNEKMNRAKDFTASTLIKYLDKKGIVFKDEAYGKKEIRDWVVSKIQANGYFVDKDSVTGEVMLRKLSKGYWTDQVDIDVIINNASQGLQDSDRTYLKQKEIRAELYKKAKAIAEAPEFNKDGEKSNGNADEIFKRLVETESQFKIPKKITGVPSKDEILQDLQNEWLAKSGIFDNRMLSLKDRMAYDNIPKQQVEKIFSHEITLSNETQEHENRVLKNYDSFGEDF